MAKETIFYNRLIQLVNHSGKSANKIERELGYSRNALHNYKNGSEPSGLRLIELSDYFGVTPEYLIGKDCLNSSLALKKFFYQLNTRQKCELIKLCEDWLEQ